MDLNHYIDPKNPATPRKHASQAVAADHARERARATAPTERLASTPTTQRQPLIGAVLIGVLVLLVVLPVSWQLTRLPAKPLQLPPAPTVASQPGLAFTPPTPTPAPAATSTPAPTIAPTALPTATPAPQTGQGLTLDQGGGAIAGNTIPPDVAPSYIDTVGAQAPHSPRGNGQGGQVGGDWVAVPPISDLQKAIIGAQAPHKVR